MKPIPEKIKTTYVAFLNKKKILSNEIPYYLKKIIPEMKEHLERIKKLHKRDLDKGFDGVFMPGLLDKKQKNGAKELRWQFFFPAKELTRIPGTKSYRRYHLHETHVQKAVKVAVRKAQISRRATPHTFTPLDNLIYLEFTSRWFKLNFS